MQVRRMEVSFNEGGKVLTGPSYRVQLQVRLGEDCTAALMDAGAVLYAKLMCQSSCHGVRSLYNIGPWSELTDRGAVFQSYSVDDVDGGKRLVLHCSGGDLWEGKDYYLIGYEDGFIEYYYVLRSGGQDVRIGEANFFGGYGLNGVWRGSEASFQEVFNPEPNWNDRRYFKAYEYTKVDVKTDQFEGGHWFFTPAPLCFGFGSRGLKRWMMCGLGVKPGQYNFRGFEYRYRDGFWLTVSPLGHIICRAASTWESPHVVLYFTEDVYEGLSKYTDYLHRHGYVRIPQRRVPDWWYGPIYCGWGEQEYTAQNLWRQGVKGEEAYWSGAATKDSCTQSVYEESLKFLEYRGIDPRIVIIDDKWQGHYGTLEPDLMKWPNLRGFIDAQHSRGRRVLLWVKMWDREGVPDSECIRDEAGNALCVDPTNPRFEERLRGQIRFLLSPNGGCIDADGFKLDFSAEAPDNLRTHAYDDGVCGIELMKKYLAIIYEEAKKAKADALVMNHCPNPYFAENTDVARLNDMNCTWPDVRDAMTHRYKVAKAACPDSLIDMDNFAIGNYKAWLNYMLFQPSMGIPSLYWATHIATSFYGNINLGPIREEDLQAIRDAWEKYRARLNAENAS